MIERNLTNREMVTVEVTPRNADETIGVIQGEASFPVLAGGARVDKDPDGKTRIKPDPNFVGDVSVIPEANANTTPGGEPVTIFGEEIVLHVTAGAGGTQATHLETAIGPNEAQPGAAAARRGR